MEEEGWRKLYNFLLYRAIQFTDDTDVDYEFFKEVSSLPCYYCGRPPSNNGCGIPHSGLDRKENNKGYIKSNVVPCCWKCNINKGSMTENGFIEHCRLVAKYQETKVLPLIYPSKEIDSYIPSSKKNVIIYYNNRYNSNKAKMIWIKDRGIKMEYEKYEKLVEKGERPSQEALSIANQHMPPTGT